MPRPSNRTEQRRAIAEAFERALATHGLGRATMAAVANEAGCAPGLIHHHFDDREDLVTELVRSLIARFESTLPHEADSRAFLEAYVDRALALKPQAGRTAAKAWVGIFAEAIRSRRVAALLQRVLRKELRRLSRSFCAEGLSPQQAERKAAGMVATILGCLVFGALLPNTAAGFAAPFTLDLLG